MTMISVETVYVLAMSVLMGLFVLGMWWEARRALREMCDEDRFALKIESEREFRRQMAREAARLRLNDLRADLRRAELQRANLQRAALSQEAALEPEHIGRILERLARVDTRTENAGERVPELNFVRGGTRQARRKAEMAAVSASDSRTKSERGSSARGNGAPLLATATR